ncbi:MAG: ABC transporter permease [bacterium]|nr:ABC transporter permease [bacterium]
MLHIIIFFIIFGSILYKVDPTQQNLTNRLKPPSKEYIFGTDELGRDVLSRVIHGGKITLRIGILAAIFSIIIGVGIGLISGWFGGYVDTIIMRFIDILLSIPLYFLILMVITMLEPSTVTVVAVIAITSWMGTARMIRAEVLKLKNFDFVANLIVLGVSKIKIFFKHILPNLLPIIAVTLPISTLNAILVEATLSFLGLGVQPPTPSWGNLLLSAKDYIHIAWWLLLIPGVFIFLTVYSLYQFGEDLKKKYSL